MPLKWGALDRMKGNGSSARDEAGKVSGSRGNYCGLNSQMLTWYYEKSLEDFKESDWFHVHLREMPHWWLKRRFGKRPELEAKRPVWWLWRNAGKKCREQANQQQKGFTGGTPETGSGGLQTDCGPKKRGSRLSDSQASGMVELVLEMNLLSWL